MRKLTLALFTGTALVSAQAAFAADLRRPAPPPPPPVAAFYNWSGFYVGGNVGWGWTDGSADFAIAGARGTLDGSGDGFLGGIQAGYNWQNGPWVIGVELDFQGSTGDGDVTGLAGGNRVAFNASTPWFGTLRGRLGYAWDRWLVYATGGALYGKSEFEGNVTGVGPFSSSETFWTWTVGGGVEWALWERWSAKLEYLYAGSPNDVPAIPRTAIIDGSTDTHIVRAGLNYRF
jgi:outer membrane immunogenic protein